MSAIQTWLSKVFHRSPKEYRVLFLGLDASGRTTTLYKLILGEVVTTIPTIGFNVETFVYKEFSFTIWDVGGCDKIRPLWRHYFQNTQAVVFFVDSSDRDRIDESDWSLGLLLTEDELQNIPVLVFANKQDKENAMSVKEVTEKLNLEKIRDRLWYVQASCAPTGDGLYEGFEWLVSVLSKEADVSHKRTTPKTTAKGDENKTGLDHILESWLAIEDGPDDEFITALEDFTLDNWDHRTHLRIAWILLTRHGRREGMKKIFSCIKNFIDNSPRARKTTFHETMTYFWTHMVHYAIEATKNPTNEFKGFLLMNPQLANGGLFLEYFTKDLMLMKMESRKQVVLPDIKPLPSIISSTTATSAPPIPPELKKHALSDTEFLDKFESKTLNQWGLEEEIRAVYVCLIRKGRRQGTKLVHSGMEKFQGSGYNLTATYFWIQMAWYYMCVEGLDKVSGVEEPTSVAPMEFGTFIEKYSVLLDRKLPLKYYSSKVLYEDTKAAGEFVLPDKKQLPSVIPKK